MEISTKTVEQIDITGAKALDPIRVILEDFSPGVGRITISVFSRAWANCAYWGAMSDRTVAQFFIDCDPDYLAGNLAWGQSLKKSDRAYLIRIIEAVQQALRQKEAVPA